MKNFQGNVSGLCETPIEILRLNMKTEPCKSTLPEICQFMKIGVIWPKFDLKLLINFFGTPDGRGVNAKVVDINKIYLNMQYGTDPSTQIWKNAEKPKFLIKNCL